MTPWSLCTTCFLLLGGSSFLVAGQYQSYQSLYEQKFGNDPLVRASSGKRIIKGKTAKVPKVPKEDGKQPKAAKGDDDDSSTTTTQATTTTTAAPILCYNGTSADVFAQCAGRCCTGTSSTDNSCSWVGDAVTVCQDSCQGVDACQDLPPNAVVMTQVCNGNLACAGLDRLVEGTAYDPATSSSSESLTLTTGVFTPYCSANYISLDDSLSM